MTPTPDDTGTCQMPVADTGVCTPRHFLCVTDDSCVPDTGSSTMGHCIKDGTTGGYCRATDPPCDGTLTCSPDTGLCG
jgi:hypothetical protein